MVPIYQSRVRTRDPHLGKVRVFVSMVGCSPPRAVLSTQFSARPALLSLGFSRVHLCDAVLRRLGSIRETADTTFLLDYLTGQTVSATGGAPR